MSAVATYGDPGQPVLYQSQSPESVRQQHCLVAVDDEEDDGFDDEEGFAVPAHSELSAIPIGIPGHPLEYHPQFPPFVILQQQTCFAADDDFDEEEGSVDEAFGTYTQPLVHVNELKSLQSPV